MEPKATPSNRIDQPQNAVRLPAAIALAASNFEGRPVAGHHHNRAASNLRSDRGLSTGKRRPTWYCSPRPSDLPPIDCSPKSGATNIGADLPESRPTRASRPATLVSARPPRHGHHRRAVRQGDRLPPSFLIQHLNQSKPSVHPEPIAPQNKGHGGERPEVPDSSSTSSCASSPSG